MNIEFENSISPEKILFKSKLIRLYEGKLKVNTSEKELDCFNVKLLAFEIKNQHEILYPFFNSSQIPIVIESFVEFDLFEKIFKFKFHSLNNVKISFGIIKAKKNTYKEINDFMKENELIGGSNINNYTDFNCFTYDSFIKMEFLHSILFNNNCIIQKERLFYFRNYMFFLFIYTNRQEQKLYGLNFINVSVNFIDTKIKKKFFFWNNKKKIQNKQLILLKKSAKKIINNEIDYIFNNTFINKESKITINLPAFNDSFRNLIQNYIYIELIKASKSSIKQEKINNNPTNYLLKSKLLNHPKKKLKRKLNQSSFNILSYETPEKKIKKFRNSNPFFQSILNNAKDIKIYKDFINQKKEDDDNNFINELFDFSNIQPSLLDNNSLNEQEMKDLNPLEKLLSNKNINNKEMNISQQINPNYSPLSESENHKINNIENVIDNCNNTKILENSIADCVNNDSLIFNNTNNNIKSEVMKINEEINDIIIESSSEKKQNFNENFKFNEIGDQFDLLKNFYENLPELKNIEYSIVGKTLRIKVDYNDLSQLYKIQVREVTNISLTFIKKNNCENFKDEDLTKILIFLDKIKLAKKIASLKFDFSQIDFIDDGFINCFINSKIFEFYCLRILVITLNSANIKENLINQLLNYLKNCRNLTNLSIDFGVFIYGAECQKNIDEFKKDYRKFFPHMFKQNLNIKMIMK